MRPESQDLPDDLSVEWLRKQVVHLLNDAASGEPDHQACAKYAEILFKMLPKGKDESQARNQDLIQQARDAIRQEREKDAGK